MRFPTVQAITVGLALLTIGPAHAEAPAITPSATGGSTRTAPPPSREADNDSAKKDATKKDYVRFRDGDWGLAVTPFIWGPSTVGTITLLDQPADVDLPIWDEIASLQMILAGDVAVRWRDLVLNVNTWYIDLGTSFNDGTTNGRVGFDIWLTDTYAKYGFAFGRGKERLELLAGARIYSAALGLNIADGPRLDDDHNWVQPLIGLEYQSSWSDKWQFRAHADMGGFDPGDDFSSNLNAAFGRRFFTRSTLWFGYKMLWTQKTWGPGLAVLETDLDLFMHGVLAGWEWAF